MNQILQTNFNKIKKTHYYKNSYKRNSNRKYTKKFKLLFTFSSIFLILTISFFSYKIIKLNTNKKLSENLSHNYNTLKLYSQKDPFNIPVGSSENEIIGNISIPKINLSYPFFSSLDNDSLKISPCRFHGDLPPSYSNLCIAGHNYDNGQFFSNLSDLTNNDEIHIEIEEKTYIYSIFNIYEVHETDLSPIYSYPEKIRQLTLVTCNNLNKKRLIVKAKFIKML